MGTFLRKFRLTSAIFLSILMNLQKLLKPCHSVHSEKSLINYITNITKISYFLRDHQFFAGLFSALSPGEGI